MITSSFNPAVGRFLVSEPFMSDQNFQRTVILLVEYGDQGSLGFVINRKLKVKIHEVVEGVPSVDAPVFMGGPVEQNTLHFVHRLGANLAGSRNIYDDIFWGGSFDDLQHQLKLGMVDPNEILFFIGYSGWGPGQLENEIERKSWIVAPEAPEFIFRKEYKDMWRQILKSMGAKYQVISNYPTDPRLN